MAKRILVLGATGMLGHMLVRVLNKRHRVYGTTLGSFEQSSPMATFLDEDRWIGGLDGCDWPSVKNVILKIQPEVVLNCIGIIKQKLNSRNIVDTIILNSLLPHRLAELSDDAGYRLIHLSTDCVFAGSPGLKRLTDAPDATDLYGSTKRLGETNIGRALTLRTGFIGRQLSGSEGLIEWVIKQSGNSINGFVNAIYSGFTTLELSRVIGKIIEHHGSLTGIYQVASKPISKFDLISLVNDHLNLGITIRPENSFICDRSLDGSRFTEVTRIPVPLWDDMITELATDDFYSFRYD